MVDLLCGRVSSRYSGPRLRGCDSAVTSCGIRLQGGGGTSTVSHRVLIQTTFERVIIFLLGKVIFLSHLQPVVEPGPFWTLVRNCQSLSPNRAAGVKHVAIQFVAEEGPFREGPFARRVALFANEIKCFNPVSFVGICRRKSN